MLGIMISPPDNDEDIDGWALVDDGVVVAKIAAQLPYMLTIQADHDYVIDLMVSGLNTPDCEVGGTYDAESNTFTPIPPDTTEQLRSALNSAAQAMFTVFGDAEGMSVANIATAISEASSDSSSAIPASEADAWAAFCDWILTQGV